MAGVSSFLRKGGDWVCRAGWRAGVWFGRPEPTPDLARGYESVYSTRVGVAVNRVTINRWAKGRQAIPQIALLTLRLWRELPKCRRAQPIKAARTG